MRSPLVIIIATLVPLLLGQTALAAPWLTAEDYGDLTVVVTQDASQNDQAAAREFALYWLRATGRELPISSSPGDAVNVYIGFASAPAQLKEDVDLDALNPDGVYIHTFIDRAPSGSKALLIAGEGDEGALYGVYEFFERFIGIRWLAPGAIFVPNPPGTPLPEDPKPWQQNTPAQLDSIDYAYTPIFEYRWTRHNPKDRDLFGRWHRLTQEPGFGLWVHTLYRLLPPEKYFKDHPEYYAMVDGKRVAAIGLSSHQLFTDPEYAKKHGKEFGQICFSNPEVVDIVTENLLQMIRENPEPRIWSVSQLDWRGCCECPDCAAITEAEGSPSGLVIHFVNQVAERVEQEFPDHYICTLAYQWSRHRPRTIRPRKNVIIRLCSIECDFARPLDDPEARENVSFAQDMHDWAPVANQLYIWDYVINFHHYLLPHPNLNVLQENMQFFAENNVRGVFEQGSGAPEVCLGYIRPYLLSRLLWNPYLDYEAAKEEFIDLFYQEAGSYYRQYLDVIHEAVIDENWALTTFDKGSWITAEVVEQARAILNAGIDAAQSEAVRERMRFELLSVEYAALFALPTAHVEGDTFVLERPERMKVAEFIAMAKEFGVRDYAERGLRLEELKKKIKDVESYRETYEIAVIENSRYLIWVVPELEGSIIRWYDKKLKRELLKGYEQYGRRPSTWQDWHNTPLVKEGPAADSYRVVESSAGKLVLEGQREDGLLVRRTMELMEAPDQLTVVLELRNTTDKPLDPSVKIHPEFYAGGGGIPEIWGKKNGEWRQLNEQAMNMGEPATGEYLKPGALNTLACRMPKGRLTLVCEFEPDPLGGILWFYNTSVNAEQVNLELLPPSKDLAPGESLVLSGTYYTTRKRPKRL